MTSVLVVFGLGVTMPWPRAGGGKLAAMLLRRPLAAPAGERSDP